LKYNILIKIEELLSTGRTSREKSIIDVLIFGNGYVLHHSPTSLQ
jgi:hypothetical protein